MQPHTIYNRKPNCGILIVPSEGARRCVPAASIETNAPRTWFLPLRANDEMPSFITEHATEGGRGQETTRRIRDVPKQVYIVCADLDAHSNLINISSVKPPGPGQALASRMHASIQFSVVDHSLDLRRPGGERGGNTCLKLHSIQCGHGREPQNGHCRF
jgi:hypothetical protein